MAEPLTPADPEALGDYRLLERLAVSGRGVLYLARSPGGAQVVVKALDALAAGDQAQRRRLAREAEAAQQAAAACTAAVVDADLTFSPPYIVSKYVDGPTLGRAVRRDGPLRGGGLYRLALATATALMAVHGAGVIHRSLNPEHVVLGGAGPQVVGFGAAHPSGAPGARAALSADATRYLAPEQVRGAPLSPMADVFAWGAVVVLAATGRPAFYGETVPVVEHQVRKARPDLDGVPEPLATLAAAAMCRDPALRPSATELVLALLGRTERPDDHEEAAEIMREAAAACGGPAGAAPQPEAAQPHVAPEPAPEERAPPSRAAIGAAALVIGLAAGAALVQGVTSGEAADPDPSPPVEAQLEPSEGPSPAEVESR